MNTLTISRKESETDSKNIALIGGRILTMCGDTIENGTILISDGKIVAIGVDLPIPGIYQIKDVTGKVITPGLIDAHTHLGLYGESLAWSGEDVNEIANPVSPGLSALDAINPADIGLLDAYRGGVTTAMITPGSTNPIGGQCVFVKTKRKDTVEAMLLRRHAGLKIAFGENPKRYFGSEQKKTPFTRMATAGLIRETLWRAQDYLSAGGAGGTRYDMGLEAVARVLRKEMPLRAHAHRADDIVTAIRIAQEFHVDIVIEHATEAHLIADVLVAERVPVILGPTLVTRSKMELKDKNFATPALLFERGVSFAMMSDHPVIPSCFLPVYAGLAVRYGLPEEQALQMITSEAAKILGIADRVGSIASGLDADLVVWSGHPLLLSSRPEAVVLDGVFDAIF